MKSWLKAGLLAFFLVAISVPLKFAVPPAASADSLKSEAAKTVRDFLVAEGVAPVEFKPARTMLRNWRATTPECSGIVIHDFTLGEAADAAAEWGAADNSTVHYVYRGQVTPAVPKFRIRTDQILARLLWPLRPSQWRAPLLVVLLEPQGCRALERLRWEKLRQDPV